MRTWEDVLRRRGEPVGRDYACPACGRPTAAFAIVDDGDGAWRCGTCRIDAARAGHLPHVADWTDVRAERDRQLADTDWTENTGARRGMTEAQAARWDALRARLRDVPQAAASPAAALEQLGALRMEAQALRIDNPKE